MKPKILVPLLLLGAAIAAIVLFLRRDPEEASMLLVNGTVYTLNEKKPVAEAVAIQGDRIIGVGSTKEITSSFTSGKVIDLQGKPVYPGFIDSHAHLEGLGAVLMNLDLSGTRTLQEIAARVKAEAAEKKEGEWVRGRGWDQNRWDPPRFPTHEVLDEVSRDVPVYLKRIDGHAAWVNRKVLEMARIDRSTPDPEGGKIIRDASGNPTGVFVDRAVDMLDTVLPAPTVAERTEAVRRAVKECLRVGLTEVHDMGVDLELLEVYKTLIRAGEFPFRVYAVIDGTAEAWDHYMKSGPDDGGEEGRLTVRALKMYADGALGSRGAALIRPYADDPGNRGLTLTTVADLTRAGEQCLEMGFQLCVHAIGDRANSMVLGAYAALLARNQAQGRDPRFRVEHAQILEPADIPRFHQLNVIPMVQPTHCTSDMPWVGDRLGAERLSGAYAWRSLLDQGSLLPGGSDFPVESPNPLWGFYSAITRQDHAGQPEGGWFPEQRMTRDEALKSFSLWGAFAGFQERTKGSIEPGKWADLTVLSADIMKIEPAQILETRVDMTIVAGAIAFSSTADAAAWRE